jgi:hypothetical protein
MQYVRFRLKCTCVWACSSYWLLSLAVVVAVVSAVVVVVAVVVAARKKKQITRHHHHHHYRRHQRFIASVLGPRPGIIARHFFTLIFHCCAISRNSLAEKGDTHVYWKMVNARRPEHLEQARQMLSATAQQFVQRVPDSQQFPLVCPAPLLSKKSQQGSEVRSKVVE